MKKVLILTSVASMVEQFLMPSIEMLVEDKYDVTIITNFKNPGTITEDIVNELKTKLDSLGVKYINCDMNRNPVSLKNIQAYKIIKNNFKKNDFDIIHLHSPTGGVLGRLASTFNKSKKTKVVYTAHGFHFYKGAPLKNWLLFYPIEYLLSKCTDILITINKEDYSLAKRRFHAKKTIYIPGVGVDKKKFKKTDERKLNKESLNLNENDFVITYIGELSYRKHQDVLINAMNIIANSHQDIKLLLVGKGDKEAEYKKLALGNEQIIFLGYRKDIVDILNITDLVVSSSRQEGLPVNIMESMSLGLPILVSNVRGNRDLVSGNAVIYEDNAYSYVDKILEAYENVELRKKLSKENKNNFKKYELENINKKIMEVYR